MRSSDDALAEIRHLIESHARADMSTPIDGLLLSKVTAGPQAPDYSLTEPLLVVMAQGGKRLLLGEQVFEYRAGQCLIVTTRLPVTGHYLDVDDTTPALAMGLTLRPPALAALVLRAPAVRSPRADSSGIPAMATGDADGALLDSVARMLRLLDHPLDAPVLAPLLEQEILWRLLRGPHGAVVRQIGLADSELSHLSAAINWMRANYAEPATIEELADMSGMSTSAFHRHFKAITAMSPLQFQKRLRLQHARTMLLARPGDVAGVGHRVGYDSPSQFNREYRRLFGAPPGADAARLRTVGEIPDPVTFP